MKTLTAILLAALVSAQAARAETSFKDLQAFAPGIYAQDLASFNEDLPAARPARSDFRDSVGQAAADQEIDTEKAALMARLALKRVGYQFGGQCYNVVWYDILVAAGFPDDPAVPGTSAYMFAEYAKANPAWLKSFKLKIIPTPDSFEAMPAGSIVVYDKGQQDAYGYAHARHGHIEVIADRDGVRYGCSDACADIGGAGGFLASPEAKERVTVFVPVK